MKGNNIGHPKKIAPTQALMNTIILGVIEAKLGIHFLIYLFIGATLEEFTIPRSFLMNSKSLVKK